MATKYKVGKPKPRPNIEPIYIRQTGEPEHLKNPFDWIGECNEQARAEGATFPRVSWWPPEGEIEVLLYEGWAEQPLDQKAPRFGLVPHPALGGATQES